MSDDNLPPNWLRAIIIIALVVVLLFVPLYFLDLLGKETLTQLVKEHAKAMLGIPWAGGAAFIVVLVFKPIFGNMKFKVIGFEFEGASGPVVLWVLCFLAEILAIKILW